MTWGREGQARGRASSREVSLSAFNYLQFDHGCQFITASTPVALEQIRDWERRGFLKHWKGRLGTYDAATCAFKDRTEECGTGTPDDQGFCNILCKGDIYVGSYCMVDACSAMYQLIGIEVKWDERMEHGQVCHETSALPAPVQPALSYNQALSVRRVSPAATSGQAHLCPNGLRMQVTSAAWQPGHGWELTTETGRGQKRRGQHSSLILADQMNVRKGSHGYVDMQAHNFCALAERVRAVKRSPRYSLMLALKQGAIRAPFDGVTVRNSSIIEWISRDTSKPGRERTDGVECWVAVTTEAFAQEVISEMPLFYNGEYVPQTKEVLMDIGSRIWDALKTILQPFIEGNPEPTYLRAQRWASAFKADPLGGPCMTELGLRMAACGDFCLSSSAEGAILSGIAAAEAIAELISQQSPTPTAQRAS
ncbi:hypothetical protein CVIRNUC_000231 [Coccomyxa viridis]|uniref:Amine oxidase n=1 Tax=Coccomyxa viridis TaxID=1274662 RepID=A0AAV1HR95_9CHLO|nr:hypothetical protein CVIRNUC_000231 [Coccomyxa viridis]